MGHPPSPTLLHRQARLGAIERLDLQLLVDRQHKAMGRRIERQSDNVAQLGGKSRILRQLETPDPVRLQAVRRPDPLHRAQRHTASHRHCPPGPVHRLSGCQSGRKKDPSAALGQACPGSEQEGPARVAQCPHERRSGARARCPVWGLNCQVRRSGWNPLFVLGRVSAQSADACRAAQTGSAEGSRPTAAKRARVSASLDAEHFQSTRQRRVSTDR